jgi:hypothetical protein
MKRVLSVVVAVTLTAAAVSVERATGAAPPRRPQAEPLLTGAAGIAAAAMAQPGGAAPSSVPPRPERFRMSAVSVTPGSILSLHWNTAAGEYYILTSSGPTGLPNFGSGSAVKWPASSGGQWNSTWRWWVSAASAVSVAIPSTASPGTTYALQLFTCITSPSSCSNSPGGEGFSQVTITVASAWIVRPYYVDHPGITRLAESPSVGEPLDVAFSGDTIWNSSEFSNAVGQGPIGQSTLTSVADPADIFLKPFAQCFSNPCGAAAFSALGERIVVANGLVWFTQGGWLFPTPSVPNHSMVVAYNPATRGFCTYIVPGDDNEVIGLAATGTGTNTRIWFVESRSGHPALDSFSPAQVGSACPSTHALAGAPSFRHIPWPQSDSPAMVTADPDGASVWVTEFWGSQISRVNVASGAIAAYRYPSSNAYSPFGALPWQAVADAGYVYAIDYGDSALVRINKSTGRVGKVPVPLTSDVEQGYGLALAGGKLYFTLSDDILPAFGAASAFGYVDVAAWEAASAKCSPGVDCAPTPANAVVYTGLAATADPSGNADFRGIAAAANGQLAIADLHQVIRLAP